MFISFYCFSCIRPCSVHYNMDNFMKVLLRTEYVFGVYRNYTLYSKYLKLFSLIRSFIEIILIVLSIFIRVKYFWVYNISETTNASNLICSIALIVLAFYHSKTYVCLVSAMKKTDYFFRNDKNYKKCLQKRYYHYIISLVLVFSSVTLGHISESFHILKNKCAFIVYIINAILCDMRYGSQFIVCQSYLYILSEQIKCFIKMVEKPKRNILTFTISRKPKTEVQKDESKVSLTKLMHVYKNIKTSAECLNTIFNLQVRAIRIYLYPS